ncbi:MAG: hypothetical protein ACRDRH_29935 [Pseudonocardia sp.]
MMADPTASIWEVTRLILAAPGSSPTEIADAHGFSSTEIAELLPIFLDNLRVDYSQASGGAPPGSPGPRPDESAEDHVVRYLGELSEHIGGDVDVVSYESFGALFLDPAGTDPGFDDVAGTSGPERPRTDEIVDMAGAEEPWSLFGSGEPRDPAAVAPTTDPDEPEPEVGPQFAAGESPDELDEQSILGEDDPPDVEVDPEPEDPSGNTFQFD